MPYLWLILKLFLGYWQLLVLFLLYFLQCYVGLILTLDCIFSVLLWTAVTSLQMCRRNNRHGIPPPLHTPPRPRDKQVLLVPSFHAVERFHPSFIKPQVLAAIMSMQD